MTVPRDQAEAYFCAIQVNPALERSTVASFPAVKAYLEKWPEDGFPVYSAKRVLEWAPAIVGRAPEAHSQEAAGAGALQRVVAALRPRESPLVLEVLERAVEAALETGNVALAERYYKALEARQPAARSRRTRRLQGLFFEARGEYGAALGFYGALLDEWGYEAAPEGDKPNPTVAQHEQAAVVAHVAWALKRIVAVHKAQGDTALAIARLVEHLGVFGADLEAWVELSHLYAAAGHSAGALFCAEEALLLAPQNHHIVLCYASLLLCAGRSRDALRYFALAVQMLTGAAVPRAVWVGIQRCVRDLVSSDESEIDLARWRTLAAEQLA